MNITKNINAFGFTKADLMLKKPTEDSVEDFDTDMRVYWCGFQVPLDDVGSLPAHEIDARKQQVLLSLSQEEKARRKKLFDDYIEAHAFLVEFDLWKHAHGGRRVLSLPSNHDAWSDKVPQAMQKRQLVALQEVQAWTTFSRSLTEGAYYGRSSE